MKTQRTRILIPKTHKRCSEAKTVCDPESPLLGEKGGSPLNQVGHLSCYCYCCCCYYCWCCCWCYFHYFHHHYCCCYLNVLFLYVEIISQMTCGYFSTCLVKVASFLKLIKFVSFLFVYYHYIFSLTKYFAKLLLLSHSCFAPQQIIPMYVKTSI